MRQTLRVGGWVAVPAALAVLIGIALRLVEANRPPAASPEAASARPAPPEGAEGDGPGMDRGLSPASPNVTADEPPTVDFDWRFILREAKPPPKLPPKLVEDFLGLHRRSAESLLAAYHALDDTNLLAEAANRFPDDPRVQWTILARNAFPEDRRKWLDRFRVSSPENSLSDYLSAEDHLAGHFQEETKTWFFGPDRLPIEDYLKTAPGEAAIQELLDGTRKPLFRNHALEARLNEEELNLAAGRSAVQSRLAASGADADLLGELQRHKNIAVSLQQLQKHYLRMGDPASAEHLAQMRLAPANRLQTGESSKLLISQLVGTASEAILLTALEANTRYDFLGSTTPKDRLSELQRQRASARALAEGGHDRLRGLTDGGLLNYLDRQRISGEVEALRWLRQRAEADAPTF